jgi:selenocysteine-specific elongation factor SelB
MPVVMGTAGHIDHGKTSLVKALTGTDCDRLQEEKKRGITIELGFASLPLPDGGSLSVIDVPGHEKFIKNMVAGTAGIDFVALVIAADEGVMPQTREHLEICSLLGIRRGLVVLTKSDLVDEDWLALVQEDVTAFLRGSFLEGAPVFTVSIHDPEGLLALRHGIAALAQSIEATRKSDVPRLPVDRVFSLPGHGTVVTGTLVTGSFSVGQTLVLMPSGRASRVRGLQRHGATVTSTGAGFRTAVNLPELEVAEIERGEVLTQPGRLFLSRVWTVRLHCLASSPRALRQRMEVHFHHGAKEVQARIQFLERDTIPPGESALALVRFAEPMAGMFADTFVIRSYSPLRTVGGGSVISPLPVPLRKKAADYEEKMEHLHFFEQVFSPSARPEESDTRDAQAPEKGKKAETLPPDAALCEDYLAAQIGLQGVRGATFAELCVLCNFPEKTMDKALQHLGALQRVFCVDKEDRRYVGAHPLEELQEGFLLWLADYHKREPMKRGVAKNAVLSGWGRSLSGRLVYFLLGKMEARGSIVAEGDMVRLPGHELSMTEDNRKLRDTLLSIHTKAGIAPPHFRETLDSLGISEKAAQPALKLMLTEGELVKVADNMYYTPAALVSLQQSVKTWFADKDDLGPGELRELTGLSRKYCIALLEYFDTQRLTMRVGEKRRLRQTGGV